MLLFRIALTLGFATVLSCKEPEPKTTTVVVMCDVSETAFVDSSYYQKNVSNLLGFVFPDSLNLNSDGGKINLSALNNISQNANYETVLPIVKSKWGPNPYIRRDEVLHFREETKGIFSTFFKNHFKDTVNQSKIYQGLCRACNSLVDDTANDKIMVVYSDFLEHSDLFSFYNKANQSFLNDPVRFYETKLKPHCELPSLTGIDMYLVSYRTDKNDNMVNQSLDFWKAILKYRGAKVKTGVDLNSMQ